jgi:hypothetical protein
MRPIILDYAIKRKGDVKPIYNYSEVLSLNVVQTENGDKLFIDISEDAEMTTKTRVRSEADDYHSSLLELKTKTEVAQERDDDVKNSLLELSTKTLVKNERDE